MPLSARRISRLLILLSTSILISSFALAPARAAVETITVWTDNGNDDQPLTEALANAFNKANPDVHVEVKVGPSGVAAVNLVKARLAAGNLDDVFVYYTGSLFQALDPTKNLVVLPRNHGRAKSFPRTCGPCRLQVANTVLPLVVLSAAEFSTTKLSTRNWD